MIENDEPRSKRWRAGVLSTQPSESEAQPSRRWRANVLSAGVGHQVLSFGRVEAQPSESEAQPSDMSENPPASPKRSFVNVRDSVSSLATSPHASCRPHEANWSCLSPESSLATSPVGKQRTFPFGCSPVSSSALCDDSQASACSPTKKSHSKPPLHERVPQWSRRQATRACKLLVEDSLWGEEFADNYDQLANCKLVHFQTACPWAQDAVEPICVCRPTTFCLVA